MYIDLIELLLRHAMIITLFELMAKELWLLDFEEFDKWDNELVVYFFGNSPFC